MATKRENASMRENETAIQFEPIVNCTTARPPRKHYGDDAGFDLFAKEGVDVVLQTNTMHTINTGVRVILPKHTYGRIAPRSSLANIGVWINGGVIDNGYSGELKVFMHNITNKDILIRDGTAIAQLIPTVFEKCPDAQHNGWCQEQMNEVGTSKQPRLVNPTPERADKGFGSTDVNAKETRM